MPRSADSLMRRRLLLAALMLPLAAGLAARTQTAPGLLIRNVDVVDVGAGTTARRTVVVRGDRIQALLEDGDPEPAGATVVPGDGRYAIPGLWDMHVHVAARPERRLAEDVALPLLLAHGVVGAREMGGPLGRVTALRSAQAEGRQSGPRLLVSGPFIDGPGDPDPSFLRVTSEPTARRAVTALADAGVDFIKVQAGLSPAAQRAVVRTAAARGLTVAGHVPASMTVADVAASGQRTIEHVSPALVSDGALLFACSSREAELHAELQAVERDRGSAAPGALRAREAALRRALVDSFDAGKARQLGARLAEAGVYVVPTLVWSARFRPLSLADTGSDAPLEYAPAAARERWRQGRADYLAAMSAGDAAANRAVAETAARAVAALHQGGAQVMAGTDAFDAFVIPGASLHEELRRLVEGGLTPLDALRAATLVPAAYRRANDEGRVAPGARADLVLLEANPLVDVRHVGRIGAVVQNGRLLTRADLDALLAHARAAADRMNGGVQ